MQLDEGKHELKEQLHLKNKQRKKKPNFGLRSSQSVRLALNLFSESPTRQRQVCPLTALCNAKEKKNRSDIRKIILILLRFLRAHVLLKTQDACSSHEDDPHNCVV